MIFWMDCGGKRPEGGGEVKEEIASVYNKFKLIPQKLSLFMKTEINRLLPPPTSPAPSAPISSF